MSQVEVTYDGNQQCTALSTKTGRHVVVDCPMTRGEEFGPDSLVAAGLGACMLISMATFAERHALDVRGARVDVDVSLGGKSDSRISAIEVTIRVPTRFTDAEQESLMKAAAACPIKHSFRSDTEISTHFSFGGVG